ncbi:hypothetical protein L6Q21_17270 [Sandaracinobacter sp. RS1-74]|uniref:hypothetical protein n=1 Tax=Sandaracinobacteroides sayramensis TaxID=2913411 RepID=UPI001EDBAB52|nr:hypothetical protein [Sandaracinobacteroides sayramensis]MCG2842729.1 hypothetical protein [Sandaracinobacteroides sayramensis]
MSILALLAASVMGLTELPPQKPVPGRCLVFIWVKSNPPLRLAMIDETAKTMRLRKGKQMFDISEIAPGQYGGHGYRTTMVLSFAPSPGITNGAIIESGSMRIEQVAPNGAPAGEIMTFPVGGMRACQ